MREEARSIGIESELLRLRALVGKLECELEQNRRLALLGTLTGSIAHEFNNLLTPILAYAEMSKIGPEDPTTSQKALEKVMVGVLHATRIADAILSLASPSETGKHGPADLRASVEAAVLCTAGNPARDHIEVSIQLEDELLVAIDPVVLQHVLLNLLLNARTALSPRGGRITVRAAAETTRSPWNTGRRPSADITVEDTGCGIAPGFLPHVFEPFVTTRSPERRSNRGRGLGLAIAKQLVERVMGSITVQSTVGAGSTFQIRLPLANQAAASEAA